MKVQEVFQSGEQTVQSARVHLEVLLQLSGVHMQHYLQCSHVMHLRLHEFCRTYIFLKQTLAAEVLEWVLP